MSTSTFLESMLRDAIGFDYLASFGTNNTAKYPPHNIIKAGDGLYNLVLAVAGFSQGELEVALEGNELTIKGVKDRGDVPGKHVEFLYQGLALRDFERVWKLEDGIQVSGVSLMNGLLTVSLKRVAPENKKKTFTIIA